MNKAQFRQALRAHLAGLQEEEIVKSLNYFSEMIDDRIDDGMDEAEAVADLGDVSEIADKILAEEPLLNKVKDRVKASWDISPLGWVLIALVAPLWLPLLLGVFGFVVGIVFALFTLVFSLLIAAASLVTAGIASLIYIVSASNSGVTNTLWCLGAGLTALGAGFILFYGFVRAWEWLRKKFFEMRNKYFRR